MLTGYKEEPQQRSWGLRVSHSYAINQSWSGSVATLQGAVGLLARDLAQPVCSSLLADPAWWK